MNFDLHSHRRNEALPKESDVYDQNVRASPRVLRPSRSFHLPSFLHRLRLSLLLLLRLRLRFHHHHAVSQQHRLRFFLTCPSRRSPRPPWNVRTRPSTTRRRTRPGCLTAQIYIYNYMHLFALKKKFIVSFFFLFLLANYIAKLQRKTATPFNLQEKGKRNSGF